MVAHISVLTVLLEVTTVRVILASYSTRTGKSVKVWCNFAICGFFVQEVFSTLLHNFSITYKVIQFVTPRFVYNNARASR